MDNLNYINAHIDTLVAYQVPKHRNQAYLLDFNERTKPFPDAVWKICLERMSESKARKYPQYTELYTSLAKHFQIKEEQVLLTNGSSEAIDLVMRACTDPQDKIIIPKPSFAMFSQYAKINRCEIEYIGYDDDMNLSKQDYIDAIRENKPKICILCNPNNPTGSDIEIEELEDIIAFAKTQACLVLLDEAYSDFSKKTALPLLNKYSNLVIVKTFSKSFGLAGLRLGCAIASKDTLAGLQKVQSPYAVNQFAVVCLYTLLEHYESIEAFCREVIEESHAYILSFLKKYAIRYYDTTANFVLFEPQSNAEEISAEEISKILRTHGICVRPMAGRIRLTMGTVEQMKYFVKIYEKYILPQKYIF